MHQIQVCMQALKRMLVSQGRQAVAMEVMVVLWPIATSDHEPWRQKNGRKSTAGVDRAIAAATLAAGLLPDIVAYLTHSKHEVAVSAAEILGYITPALAHAEVRNAHISAW